MSLDLLSIPLAAGAGALGVLSPCVWPLVPVVMSSATEDTGRAGPLGLAAGLATSFAVAGTLVSWALVSTGLDPELLRFAMAGLLVLVGGVLLVPRLTDAVAARGSQWIAALPFAPDRRLQGAGPFAVGFGLGFVWLPCVGPTLGAAIALASVGQELGLAFVTMLAYGLGTAAVLLLAATLSRRVLQRARPGLMQGAHRAKPLLGATLALLGLLVLTGIDKRLEVWAVGWLPDWTVMF